MPKRRKKKITAQEKIAAFTAGAENITKIKSKPKSKGAKNPLDPNAPRRYKTISVPFNEYEFKELEKAIEKTKRTKLNFIRWAMLEMTKDC